MSQSRIFICLFPEEYPTEHCALIDEFTITDKYKRTQERIDKDAVDIASKIIPEFYWDAGAAFLVRFGVGLVKRVVTPLETKYFYKVYLFYRNDFQSGIILSKDGEDLEIVGIKGKSLDTIRREGEYD